VLTDFHKKLILELQNQGAEFILVGGHAALLYGSERTTGDMDLLVNPTFENGQKIIKAFLSLGLQIDDLQPEDFEKELVLSFGFDPNGVDIINHLRLADYKTINRNASSFIWEENFQLKVIDARDLLAEKKNLQREGKKGLTDQIDILSLQKYIELNSK
jgi:hypothetical protein